MSAEENSIFDEINEEIRHDEFLKFLKKHKNAASWVVILSIIGIIGHSAWYSNKKNRLEISTTSLYNEIYSSAMKNEADKKKSRAALENLIKNAPSELVPLISLIKTGREIGTSGDTTKTAKQLLELSERKGVDLVWQDLAMLMYVSYKLEPNDKLLAHLEKLVAEGRPFRFTAMEKIAIIHENNGDHDKAIAMLTKIIDNKEAPKSMKERISKLINYMKNHEYDRKHPVVEKKKKTQTKSSSKKTIKNATKRKQFRR